MNASDTLLHQPVAQAVAWALLHFVWQGALVAAVTGLVLLALRRSAADIRYVVATIGMAMMLTLPVVTGVQKWQSARAVAIEPAQSLPPSAAYETGRPTVASTARSSAVASPLPTSPLLDRARVAAARVEPMLPTMLFVWLSGVSLLSLRLLTGWLWIQRLRTHGVTPAGDAWQSMAVRLARRLHLTRRISLLESCLVDVPTVVGWMKPVVLLPVSALAGLSAGQLEAILAHELAHIRRHDYLVNLLQTLVETLLFYHPAVWWLSGRIRAERENCCDDLAVSLCGDPVTYASALADLEALRCGRSLAMAANGGSLLQRVRRLLGAPTSHAGRGPAWLAGTAAALVIAGFVMSSDGFERRAQAQAQPASAPVVAPARPSQKVHASIPPSSATTSVNPGQPEALDSVEQARVMLAQATLAAADAQDVVEPALAATDQAIRAIELAQQGLVHAEVASQLQIMAEAATLAAHASTAATTVAPALAAVEATMANARVMASTVTQTESSSQHESKGSWIWSNNGEKLSVSYDGSFDFTDDDQDVSQISQGGYLKISDEAWVGRHTVEIHERGGSLERRYYVNGTERPYEPEGRQWLHDKLPKFVRNTGIGADRRVARFLKSGGPAAVMAEIARVDGGYVKRIYFGELFKQGTLNAEQYRQAMAQASREIKSDYELATLLIAVADRLPADEQSRGAYFAAAGGIQSDYELRRVYSTMLKKGPVSSPVLAGILEHSSTIESDYELSELLRQIVAQQPLDDRTRAPFFQAVATVQGAYERHRILSAVVDRPGVDPASIGEALKYAATMHSDYEAASFLLDVLKQNSIEGAARAPFFTVVGSISGSYERGRVLQAVVRKSEISDDTLLAVLKACGQMPGAYERAQVLLLVASSHTLSGSLRDAYIDAADRLGSYEQGQVMTALVKSERRGR